MIIGITVGAYDLFHIGHLNLLRNARAKCDKLIVGIASSDRIFKYKNKRPIFTDDERLDIVRNCRFVDDVFLNDSDPNFAASYTNLAKQYTATRWLVGSDWQGNAKWVEIGIQLGQIGCELVYLPHTSGVSTTDIIKRILETGNKPE